MLVSSARQAGVIYPCISVWLNFITLQLQEIGCYELTYAIGPVFLNSVATNLFRFRSQILFVGFFQVIFFVVVASQTYDGLNFNSGNYLFTTDKKQIHVSKFYCPSMQSPALCTTRCQRCRSHRILLAAPVVLIVRMERSTA